MTTRKHPIAASLALYLSITAPAGALSIGPVTVHSYLMQPLDAEIQLLGTETLSAEDLKVELGATDDFKRLQIAWESLPVQLRFTPEKKGKQWFIHVTSKEPVEQPYLEFPLSVKQGKVRLIKGITLLLDPSDFATPHAAPPGRAKKVTASPASATEAPLVDSSGRKIAPPIRAYKVKPGETLWPIAYYLRSDEVTSQQMMIALQRMNPDAFEDGNINKLKAGAVLVVPTTEQVKRINREEALKAFARQEKAWKSGEQLPTDAQPSAPSHSAEIPEKTTADTARGDLPVVEPAVEATMVPHDDKGRLEVLPPSRPGENPQQEEPLQQEILRQEETASSEQVTQSNLLQELRLLRVQVREMQELLKFKDQQIATLQSIIDAQRLASVQPPVTATVQGRAGSMSASPRTETNTDLLDPVAAGNTPLPPPLPAEKANLTDTPGNAQTPEKPATPVSTTGLPVADSPEPETPDTIPPAPAAGDHRAAYWGLAGVLGLALLGWLVWRRKRSETGTAALDIPLAAHPEVLNRGPRPYENVRDHPPEDDHEHASDVSDQEVAFSSPRVQGDQDSENMQPHTVQPNEELDIAPPPSRVELHELDSELLPTPAGLDLEDDSAQQELIGLWEHVDTLDLNEADSSLIDESATLSELNEEEDQSLEIVLEMARAYVELGDREEATAILQKALSSADSEEKRARIQSVLEEIA